ncbi:MAG TPA: tetratricopeptide repeat protein, partial [Armatimonadota bacterium]|nr:tetratricopeptide repeat protein [Armatimonadota bacterium]
MNVTETPGPSGPLESALQALDERRPQDAAAVLRDHLWRDPTDAVGYAVLGVSLAQLGDTESALEALEHAHYLHPNNTRILFNYGLALESAGRPRDARIRLAAAVRLDPDYEPARLHLARLETQGQAATADDFALLDRGASAPSVTPSVARERVPTDEEIEQGLRGLLETAPWVQNP